MHDVPRTVPGTRQVLASVNSTINVLLLFIFCSRSGSCWKVQKQPGLVQVKGVCVGELLLVYRDLIEAGNQAHQPVRDEAESQG